MPGKPAPKRPTSKPAEPPGPSTPALAEADVSTLEFVGKKATITVVPAGVRLERTIEGASSLTVTIHDPGLEFLNSEAIQGDGRGELHAEVIVDGLVWSLRGLTLMPEHMVQVVLEDDAVAALRDAAPLTMSRGKVTRAQFIKRMFNDEGIELIAPELTKKQKIAKPEEEESEKEKEDKAHEQATRAQKDKERKPGLADHAELTIEGQPIDTEQRENLEISLAVAQQLGAGSLATVAMVCAGCGESKYRKVTNASGHMGVYQSSSIAENEVAKQAHYFLVGGESFQAGGAIALAKQGLSPGDIATKVEASGEPGSFYGKYQQEAERIVHSFTGGNPSALTGESETYAKSYQFKRKAGEGTWAAARRLAEEVDWYLFLDAGVGVFASGPYLESSRPRMLVAPGADGIDQVAFDYMTKREEHNTITVTCHAKVWQAPPGSVAEVEGYGPLDGRWIVAQIVRENMALDTTTVTRGRPVKPKLEPAHEVATRASSSSSPTVAATGPANTATPTASWNPHHRPIATWIVPILEWASHHGWKGSVTSGYRTNAEQMTAATAFGLNRYGPGGPLASNHCGNQAYPKGAVDVTGGSELQEVLKAYPSKPSLVWGGTSIEDAVHYSATGD